MESTKHFIPNLWMGCNKDFCSVFFIDDGTTQKHL